MDGTPGMYCSIHSFPILIVLSMDKLSSEILSVHIISGNCCLSIVLGVNPRHVHPYKGLDNINPDIYPNSILYL